MWANIPLKTPNILCSESLIGCKFSRGKKSMKITMGYVIPGPVRCLQILSNHLAVRFVVHLCPYSQGDCFGDIIHSL